MDWSICLHAHYPWIDMTEWSICVIKSYSNNFLACFCMEDKDKVLFFYSVCHLIYDIGWATARLNILWFQKGPLHVHVAKSQVKYLTE